MAEGMFGGPVGTRAYAEDLMNAMNTVSSMDVRVAQIPNIQANTRLHQAEAAVKEQQAREAAAMAQIMKVGQPGALPPGVEGPPAPGSVGGSMADYFNQKAREAATAGLPVQAQKLAETASKLWENEAQTNKARTSNEVERIKLVANRAEMIGQVFGNATNEADWRRAQAVYEFQTGQPSPYSSVPYSPQLVDSIRQQAVTVKEQLNLEEKRLTREELTRYRNARLGQHNANLDIARERLDLERQREDRLKKAGGGKGAAGAPTEEEMKEVKRQLKLGGVETDKIGAESLNSTAFTIGSRARELQKENPALGRAAALQRAIGEAKANGELEAEKVDTGMFSSEQRFRRGPAAAPAEASKRTVGRKYQLPNGKIGTWREGGWEVE